MARHIIVIGGGPAGLLAAGTAARLGADVLMLEKMGYPGRKLRITGKGRCNITNIATMDEFLPHFGPSGRFLRQSFGAFFNDDLLDFIHGLGVPTVTERGGRVFPASDEAGDVVEALVRWAKDGGVNIYNESSVQKLIVEDGSIKAVQAAHHPSKRGKNSLSKDRPEPVVQTYQADAVIVATGGSSYPGTGSTGDGFKLAKAVGHKIERVRPALIPLDTAGNTAQQLAGLSLRNVQATLWVNNRKFDEAFGEMLFTHQGLSGPIILTLSKHAVDALYDDQDVSIGIDLKPALDDKKLDTRLLRDLDQHGKQQFQTLLKGLLPRKLIPVCIDLVGIPADRMGHQITSKERKRLLRWLKDFRLDVNGHRPMAQAIVTAGGVNLREVDPRTMQSRIVDGLYFAGEVLDIDADTGGYNLQAAFSTGRLAGENAAQTPG